MVDATNSYFGRNGSSKTGVKLEFYHVPSGKSISFKAFLTSMTDSFQSNYNEEQIFGRMDPFQIYQGTQRSLSLAWEIPAYSSLEAKENLRKCSLLAAFLYPSYDSVKGGGSVIKGTPIIKIKFANLITSANKSGATAKRSGLAGAMQGLQFNPVTSEGYTFDPATGRPTLYPKLIELSCDFSVIHQHALGWKNRRLRGRGMKNFPYGLSTKNRISTSANASPTTPDAAVEAANVEAVPAHIVAAQQAEARTAGGELSEAQKQMAADIGDTVVTTTKELYNAATTAYENTRSYVKDGVTAVQDFFSPSATGDDPVTQAFDKPTLIEDMPMPKRLAHDRDPGGPKFRD